MENLGKLPRSALPSTLAVNLQWTCSLSSLVTDQQTCFSADNSPHVSQKPEIPPLLLPPLLSQWEKLWRSLRTQQEQHQWLSLPHPPVSEEMSEPVPSPSRLSGRGAACMSVMGCGRGTEASGQTVNNYRDVGALERGAALTAVTHTRGTVLEMENCQIMFRHFAARNKLWMELWVHSQRRDIWIKMGV